MFEYSKFAFKQIVNTVKRWVYWSNVAMQSVIVFYLAYALFAQAGKLWANIPLFILCAAYLVYFLLSTKFDPLYKPTQTQKRTKKAVKYSKLFIKFCTLGVTMYGIYVATTHVTAFSLILTVLSIITWLLQVILEMITLLVENLAKTVQTAVEADVEEILKPITSVKNFFKKATGKDADEPKEKSKKRVWMDEHVQQIRKQRAEDKIAKKQAKRQAKQQAKLDKKNKRTLPKTEEPLLLEHKEENEHND